jgi:DNA-binding response OmpR family regulator
MFRPEYELGAPELAASNLRRLHPVRVLLVGRDRRFLRAAGAFLFAEGHVVESSGRPSQVLELVHRLNSDVAVIDASGSLGEAARAAASLRALPTPVAAVLVADAERTSPGTGLSLLSKWGGFEELSARIEEAYEWRRLARA